jgi:hypothetical protein
MLFLLASFTITLSRQLFCACSITLCLLFCANVYISPCYFTLCPTTSSLSLLFCTCASRLLHRISLVIPTFQLATSPFKLLPYLSTYCSPLVFRFVLFCASFHFVSPNTSPYYFLRHPVTSHFFKYLLLLPPLVVKLLVILCFVSCFSHILSNEILKAHHAQILSCYSLGTSA